MFSNDKDSKSNNKNINKLKNLFSDLKTKKMSMNSDKNNSSNSTKPDTLKTS